MVNFDPERLNRLNKLSYLEKILVGYSPMQSTIYSIDPTVKYPTAYASTEFMKNILKCLDEYDSDIYKLASELRAIVVEISPHKKFFSSEPYYKKFTSFILKNLDMEFEKIVTNNKQYVIDEDIVLVPLKVLDIKDGEKAMVRVSADFIMDLGKFKD